MATPRTTPTDHARLAPARGRFDFGAFFAHKDRLPPPNVAPPPAERPRHTPALPGRRTRRRLRWGRRASLPLAAWLALTAWADPAPGVQRLALNPNAVVAVPVATDRLTTVRFPGPIAGLEAAFIATQPHPEARFLLSFQPGQPFFSLQAARPHATATLNVLLHEAHTCSARVSIRGRLRIRSKAFCSMARSHRNRLLPLLVRANSVISSAQVRLVMCGI